MEHARTGPKLSGTAQMGGWKPTSFKPLRVTAAMESGLCESRVAAGRSADMLA